MVNKSIQSIAEDYFANLNPMATRIHNDITEIRLAYENLWDNLEHDEKNDIINDGIIKPEISLQYALLTPSEEEISFNCDLNSYNRNLITGQKIIHDENISYRDEHSAPFNMKTNSQLNLSIFGFEPTNKPQNKVLPGAKPDLPVEKSGIKGFSYTSPQTLSPMLIKPAPDANFISELKSRTQVPKKPKNKEDTSYYDKSDKQIYQNHDDDILPKQNNFDAIDELDSIKSGYDFLDNW